MDRVFNAMLDRTRSRLNIPALRTLFGARRRPGKYGTAPSPRVGVALETPAWDLTVFKVHFGLLTLNLLFNPCAQAGKALPVLWGVSA